MQFVNCGAELKLITPPPYKEAELALNMQFVNIGDDVKIFLGDGIYPEQSISQQAPQLQEVHILFSQVTLAPEQSMSIVTLEQKTLSCRVLSVDEEDSILNPHP